MIDDTLRALEPELGPPESEPVALNGVPVRSMNALVLLVRERKAGGTVHLTVERAGTTIMFDAVLQDRPYDAPPEPKPSSTTPIRT